MSLRKTAGLSVHVGRWAGTSRVYGFAPDMAEAVTRDRALR